MVLVAIGAICVIIIVLGLLYNCWQRRLPKLKHVVSERGAQWGRGLGRGGAGEGVPSKLRHLRLSVPICRGVTAGGALVQGLAPGRPLQGASLALGAGGAGSGTLAAPAGPLLGGRAASQAWAPVDASPDRPWLGVLGSRGGRLQQPGSSPQRRGQGTKLLFPMSPFRRGGWWWEGSDGVREAVGLFRAQGQ